MKDLTLKFKGYQISGVAHLVLWGGDQGTINMDKCFIPADELTHNRIKTCVNDAGFGCEKITSATVDIHKVYGEPPYYKEYNRSIQLDAQQCFDGIRGVFYE